MGNYSTPDGVIHNISSYKTVKNESYNCKVAMWHLPYNKNYTNYDTDNSKWFEASNKNSDNEIEEVEKNCHISLSRYKVYTQTIKYTDGSTEELANYPNGNQVKISKGINHHTFVQIKDKFNRIIAEKMYNKFSNEGRKVTYKYSQEGNNIFAVVKVYSYDSTQNKSSDIVNFGYNSLFSEFTKNSEKEKEYYMLNGKEVNATLSDSFEYEVTDDNGNKHSFSAE